MIRKPGWNRRGGGFTLIELITVMGIIGILVAMIIGAAGAVREHIFEQNTKALFEGLSSALDCYYSDYGSYPWHDKDSPYPMMSLVDGRSGLNPLALGPDPAFTTDGGNAMLVATLSQPQRRASEGYFRPSGGQIVERKNASGLLYRLFEDGWGRPIFYYPPDMAMKLQRSRGPGQQGTVTYDSGVQTKDIATGKYQGMPVLESLGRDEFDGADNIVSYGKILVDGK
jgi:prepilin-type N-terminal cleavage/methylation domain-containing protein